MAINANLVNFEPPPILDALINKYEEHPMVIEKKRLTTKRLHPTHHEQLAFEVPF